MTTTPLTAESMRDRLHKRLQVRAAQHEVFDAYYRGDHPLPWLAPQAREEFRRILRMTRTNAMGLVVDSMVERIAVSGFRLGDKGDAKLWRIWQANNMDSASDQAWLEAGIGGASYMMTAPNPKDPSTPIWTVEHPNQVITATSNRVTVAGLKVWVDDWTAGLFAELYTALGVYKWLAEKVSDTPEWKRWEPAGETWGGRNVMGEVPLDEIPNRPRLLTPGVSELDDVIDIQDRINKTIADRLITQDYGAFPQRWITAWPAEDEKGNLTPPIELGRNRIVTSEVAETRYGQWETAQLDPYNLAKKEDIRDIASRTRTPAQYLLGDMSNVNGETLKASESGLVSKVRFRQRGYGEGLENSARRVRRLAGLEGAAESLETIWIDPQYRTPGELADASVKLLAAGVIDLRQAREDCGYSEVQILAMEARARAAATERAAQAGSLSAALAARYGQDAQQEPVTTGGSAA